MKPGNNQRDNPRGKQSTEEHQRAQAELMWQDRLNGLTNRQISDKFEVSLRTVTNRFEKYPKEGFDRTQKENSGGEIDVARSDAAKMWDDKVNHRMSNEQLAEKYQVSPETVKKRLNGYFPQKTMVALEKHRMREDDKLDMLEEEMMVLLNKEHYVVDKGHVILDPATEKPLIDSEPKFKAVDRMLKIIEAKRKMHGLDAPVRAEVTHNAGVEIHVKEVQDHVAEAHRKNQETLARIKEQLGIESSEVTDAEIVDDGSAPTGGSE